MPRTLTRLDRSTTSRPAPPSVTSGINPLSPFSSFCPHLTPFRDDRIREDTAKYLRNLDVTSAYYDPKTRSMRDNPNKDRDAKDLDYAGDNFVRYTGESKSMMDMQSFCWDANDKGVEISMQANPTQAELMNQGFREKKEDLKEKTKQSILEKYGGAEHLEAPPKELLYSQTERYVEYSRTGQLVKGQEQRLAKSRYEEDGTFAFLSCLVLSCFCLSLFCSSLVF